MKKFKFSARGVNTLRYLVHREFEVLGFLKFTFYIMKIKSGSIIGMLKIVIFVDNTVEIKEDSLLETIHSSKCQIDYLIIAD